MLHVVTMVNRKYTHAMKTIVCDDTLCFHNFVSILNLGVHNNLILTRKWKFTHTDTTFLLNCLEFCSQMMLVFCIKGTRYAYFTAHSLVFFLV